MVYLIEFSTAKFDIEREPANDINPIAGQSVLAWMKPLLEESGFDVSTPGTEDWGWYLDVTGPSGRYLVGAMAMPGPDSSSAAWMLQVHRRRGIGARLRRKGRLDPRDPVLARVIDLVEGEADFENVDVRAEE